MNENIEVNQQEIDALQAEFARVTKLIKAKKNEIFFYIKENKEKALDNEIETVKQSIKNLQRGFTPYLQQKSDETAEKEQLQLKIASQQKYLSSLIVKKETTGLIQLNRDLSELQVELAELVSARKLLVGKNHYNTEEPKISDHALVRYLERIEGIDMDEVRAKILDEATIKKIQFAKSCDIISNGYTLIVRDSVVVTLKI